MKTLLLFLLIFIGSTDIYAQSFSNGQEIELQDSKNIKPKDWTGIGTPIRRSISFQPIHAYLYNNMISIDFEEIFSAVTVKITNETTGEKVYSGQFVNPASFSVDLNGEDPGDYMIEVIADEISLEGYFFL